MRCSPVKPKKPKTTKKTVPDMYVSALDEARFLFSDLYKETRGFRPRGQWVSEMTLSELEKEIEKLEEEIQEMLAEQEEDADPDAWEKYV